MTRRRGPAPPLLVLLAIALVGVACQGPVSDVGVEVAFVNMTDTEAQVFWATDDAGLAGAQPEPVSGCTVMRRGFTHGTRFIVEVKVAGREDRFELTVPEGAGARQDQVLITANVSTYKEGVAWDGASVPCIAP